MYLRSFLNEKRQKYLEIGNANVCETENKDFAEKKQARKTCKMLLRKTNHIFKGAETYISFSVHQKLLRKQQQHVISHMLSLTKLGPILACAYHVCPI